MVNFFLNDFKKAFLSYALAACLQYLILPSPSISLDSHIAIFDNWIFKFIVIILDPLHSFIEAVLNLNVAYIPSFALLVFLTIIFYRLLKIFWKKNKT